jgi:hypothetical protein
MFEFKNILFASAISIAAFKSSWLSEIYCIQVYVEERDNLLPTVKYPYPIHLDTGG